MSSEQKPLSFTTMIPLILMAAATVVLLNIMNPGEKKNKNHDSPVSHPQNSASKAADFIFPVGGGRFENTIETDMYVAVLSDKGGRIEKLYLKNNDSLKIPKSVLRESKDPIALEKNALEVTRENGMDFQPHIYYWDDQTQQIIQIGNPPLNEGGFRKEGPFRDEVTGIQEVRYSIPVNFKGHRLELVKVFRFLPGEYFIHHITVLRNLENKPFTLGGDLFYKTMGDIGPAPEPDDTYSFTRFNRFFYYKGSLTSEQAIHTGNGGTSCSPLGFCNKAPGNDHYSVLGDDLNSLTFVGTTSKYFFAYNLFLGNELSALSSPDGVVMVKENDPTGRNSFTAFFRNFQLDPSTGKPVDTGDVKGDLDTDTGKIRSMETSNYNRLRKSQKRLDALTVDNMVYVGIRRDESHVFKDKNLMKAEFGLDKPHEKPRDVIYNSGFFTLFSGIRDAVVWLMRILYGVIGNYGWVIILIASSLKLLTWPLNQMQAKSMKRMSALKPDLEIINEKYKDDPKEKQRQTMEIYKKHNVNPAKGCLPILIQIPVFIALYSAFSESIELWRSPFILWMTDLSKPDTVFIIKDFFILHNFHINILPLIMVVSQVLQQMFTTVVTDSQQKTIMYFMPVVMIFFFWSMPSGVTLYWTIQNIMAILWQVAVDKFAKD